MEEIVEGFLEALRLIASLDRELVDISLRSICVSGLALLLASAWGIPIALCLSMAEFKGKALLKRFFEALLGLPTTSLGLLLFLLFCREGPLGFLRLLYTPVAISLGQAILITPIVVCFAGRAIESVAPEIRELARTLGASGAQEALAVLREARVGMALALIAAFNRAIAELGVALMVGGNIRGWTRVLTTAIALETAKGDLPMAIALTLVLLALVAILNGLSRLVGRLAR